MLVLLASGCAPFRDARDLGRTPDAAPTPQPLARADTQEAEVGSAGEAAAPEPPTETDPADVEHGEAEELEPDRRDAGERDEDALPGADAMRESARERVEPLDAAGDVAPDRAHDASSTRPASASEASPPPPVTSPLAPTTASAPAAVAGQHRIPGLRHTWQKWNNCGPSSLTMAMSAFGLDIDQLVAAATLKPDREDTNVSPEEMAAYARSQGLLARVGYGGHRDLVRALVHIGVPVIAEQWIDVDGRGEMGHYRVVMGYDNATSTFSAHDSYYGASRPFGYDEFERMWRPFLGAYVIVYPPDQAALVEAVLGADADPAAMWSRVLAEQEAWVARDAGSAWAHFALGEARSRVGDHAGAVEAFDRANAIGLPFRAYWYQFGYLRSLVEVGAFEQAIAHADATLASMQGENLEESHYWKGIALRRLGREDEARASLERAVFFNPNFAPAAQALGR